MAADYANAMQRNLNPEVGSYTASTFYIIKGAEDYNSGKVDKDSVGVKALDDKTLEITLNQPVPYFIQMINSPTLTPFTSPRLRALRM